MPFTLSYYFGACILDRSTDIHPHSTNTHTHIHACTGTSSRSCESQTRTQFYYVALVRKDAYARNVGADCNVTDGLEGLPDTFIILITNRLRQITRKVVKKKFLLPFRLRSILTRIGFSRRLYRYANGAGYVNIVSLPTQHTLVQALV